TLEHRSVVLPRSKENDLGWSPGACDGLLRRGRQFCQGDDANNAFLTAYSERARLSGASQQGRDHNGLRVTAGRNNRPADYRNQLSSDLAGMLPNLVVYGEDKKSFA